MSPDPGTPVSREVSPATSPRTSPSKSSPDAISQGQSSQRKSPVARETNGQPNSLQTSSRRTKNSLQCWQTPPKRDKKGTWVLDI